MLTFHLVVISLETKFRLHGYTWSQCAYYLQTSTYSQLSETANPKLNLVKNENDAFSQPEQNENDKRLVEKTANKKVKAQMSRTMDRNPEDLYRRFFMEPDQPEDARLLRVAIIGAPNAGKSTLINTLMGWKVNSVSKKVHTTRKNANTVFNIENAQIILVDTPGVITKSERKRHCCDKSMKSEPERSLHEADAVGVIVDASNSWTRNQLHIELLKVLYLYQDIPSFLILNKIDAVRKKSHVMLDVTRRLCDGKIGGEDYGRIKQRRRKKKEMPKAMFDELEEKYGKFRMKGKRTLERKEYDALAKTDTNEDSWKSAQEDIWHEAVQRGLQDEFSDILMNYNRKANSSENNDEKRSFSKDLGEELSDMSKSEEVEVYKVDNVDKNVHNYKNGSLDVNLGEGIGDSIVTCHNEKTICDTEEITCDTEEILCDKEEITCDNEKDAPVNRICNDEIHDKNETTEISGQNFLDSEKDLSSDNGVSEFSKDKTGNLIDKSSDNEKVKTELEESYQSEFLAYMKSQIPQEEVVLQVETKDHSEMSEKDIELRDAHIAVRNKHGWPGFDKVFPVSALDGSGIDQIKEHLLEISRPGDWVYHSSVISDQNPFDIAKMCLTQSFLDNMDSYLPYSISPEIISWDVDTHNRLNISMDVTVQNSYEMKLIFGNGGAERMRNITASARQALMDAFQSEVRFKLAIKQRRRR